MCEPSKRWTKIGLFFSYFGVPHKDSKSSRKPLLKETNQPTSSKACKSATMLCIKMSWPTRVCMSRQSSKRSKPLIEIVDPLSCVDKRKDTRCALIRSYQFPFDSGLIE